MFEKVGLFAVGEKHAEDDEMWFRIFAYFPIAVSKTVTTIYDRTNCAATAKRVEPFEAPFLKRVEVIVSSPEVSHSRKNNLLVWLERNKLSYCRKYILFGDKRRAAELLRTIDAKKVNKKKYFETIVCMLIPSVLIKKIIDRRDNLYYQYDKDGRNDENRYSNPFS